MPIIFPAPHTDESLDVLLGDNAAFFAVQRQLTSAYIAENPVQVVLTPRVRAKTTSGGYAWVDQTPRASQTVRLIEYTTVAGARGSSRVSEGQVNDHSWQMMMEWDASVAVNDTFTYDGHEWDVTDLLPYDRYQRRAVVERRGA